MSWNILSTQALQHINILHSIRNINNNLTRILITNTVILRKRRGQIQRSILTRLTRIGHHDASRRRNGHGGRDGGADRGREQVEEAGLHGDGNVDADHFCICHLGEVGSAGR